MENKSGAILKGKTVESLQTTTYENIILKPLYTEQDEKPVPDYPGGSDFRRGIYPLGYLTNNWMVAQQLSYETVDELQENSINRLKKVKQQSHLMSQELVKTETNLAKLLAELPIEIPIFNQRKRPANSFLAELDRIVEQEGAFDKVTWIYW